MPAWWRGRSATMRRARPVLYINELLPGFVACPAYIFGVLFSPAPMNATPDAVGRANRARGWRSWVASVLMLPACLFLFAGCATGPVDPSARSDGSKAMRIIELYGDYQGGTLVDEWMRLYFNAELDSLRNQDISDSALRDVEDVIRRYLTTYTETAIAPVFTSAYSSQQMVEILSFLETPAGKEFVDERHAGTLSSAIVANLSPENRDAAAAFMASPTGRMFLNTYNNLAREATMQAQNLIMRRQSDLTREIQRIIESDIRTQLNTGRTPAILE